MPESPNQTRQALLDAAERLFSSRGYAAVGTREIAEQAGVNLASINYHFGSKHDLYLETVRRAMGHHGDELLEMLAEPPDDPEKAGLRLVSFIHQFFGRLIEEREVDACGLLMIREALQPSEAIDAVVRDYMRPGSELLVGVLRALRPELDSSILQLHATSLMGQLIHYKVFRPFIERLRGIELNDRRIAAECAEQVALFTLRGLGCDETLVERVMRRAEAEAEALRKGTLP